MSLINYQSTIYSIKVPFPPSITVDEIVQLHLKNGIKSVNQTMNAFMIYRKEYNRIVAKFNLALKEVSKISSISWQNEPQNIKDYYKQLAKNVKRRFEEIVPSLYITCINHPILPFRPINLPLSFRNIDQKFLNAYPSFPNSTLLNINQDSNPSFLNADLFKYMTMDDDELINYLPEGVGLTYKALVQSLPPQWLNYVVVYIPTLKYFE
ncbi:317_t:CDS:2 [Diversispora eburnea]|uniref:317_t:CDS:1 n=1 Tax=Diversispora eburnea TaxID=1213867 RepID=A0A9N8ZCT2_9GLOM|nr:317_t:CDS:2 [Diversispora eburnea]